jgi:hypothetical protein
LSTGSSRGSAEPELVLPTPWVRLQSDIREHVTSIALGSAKVGRSRGVAQPG